MGDRRDEIMGEECDLLLLTLKTEEGTMNQGICRALEAEMSSTPECQKRMLIPEGLANEVNVRHLPMEC